MDLLKPVCVDPHWFNNADPNQAFYLSADPDQDGEHQTNADPDPNPSQTSVPKKVEFFMKNSR